MTAPVLDLEDLAMAYGGANVLEGVSLRLNAGEFVVLLGASGAGKTTLFKIISGVAVPRSGKMRFEGAELAPAHHDRSARARRAIGYIFQNFNLIRRRSALSNALAGLLGRSPTWRVLLGRFRAEDRAFAMSCLAQVGLREMIWRRADQLSGGQQQRVAIARALVQECRLILADEPVASLDPETSRAVLTLLRSVARTQNVAILCSLHQLEHAFDVADRIVGLKEGRILFDLDPRDVTPAHVSALYGADDAPPVPVIPNPEPSE